MTPCEKTRNSESSDWGRWAAPSRRACSDLATTSPFGTEPQQPSERWAGAGATVASSPAEVASGCDYVFVCVTDTAAVEQVVFGHDGIAAAAESGMLLIDHSTIHPLRTREYAERLLRETGMGWLDVPMTGGVAGAVAGTLVLMAGGETADVEKLRPVARCYSKRLTHMGPSGAGQVTKIANQMIIGANVAIVAEALNLAANYGVSAQAIPDALSGGWADSVVLQNHGRRMAAAEYPDSVDATIMAKDIDIACDLGQQTVSPMPINALVQQLYRQLIANGDSDKGQIGLMWLYKQGPI